MVTPTIDKDTRYETLSTCYCGDLPRRANLAYRISGKVRPNRCKRYTGWATSVAVPVGVAGLAPAVIVAVVVVVVVVVVECRRVCSIFTGRQYITHDVQALVVPSFGCLLLELFSFGTRKIAISEYGQVNPGRSSF